MFANCRHDVHKRKVERFDSRLIVPRHPCDSAWYTIEESSNGVTIYNERLYDVTTRICITSITQNSSTPEPTLSPSTFLDTSFPQPSSIRKLLCVFSDGTDPFNLWNIFPNIFYSLFSLLVFNSCACNYCGIINQLIYIKLLILH